MPTVLVVDDSAVDRRLAGGLLERTPNLDVRYADSGNDALAQIDVELPDLVVTDLQMPDIDGLQLVTSINERYPEVPVVLMTAHGSEVIAAQALASGAASYVPKSELAETLLETVMQILAMAQSDQRYRRLIQCSTRTEFEFELHNDPELIEPLVDLIQQVVTSMRLCDASTRVRLGVALEHALQNAMVRGNLEIPRSDNPVNERDLIAQRREQGPYNERRVHFSARITRDKAQFEIRDDGPGFDVTKIPRPDDPECFRDGSGRGLVLIQAFLDEVDFGEKGNQISMVKYGAHSVAKPR